MKIHDPGLLPPSPNQKRKLPKIIQELSFVVFSLAGLYGLATLLVYFNYTKHAQNATISLGKQATKAILAYAADYDQTLPMIFDQSEQTRQLLEQKAFIYGFGSPEVDIAYNSTLAGREITALDPKTELFTITNTYMWNNYKVVHHLDGTTTQSDLPKPP